MKHIVLDIQIMLLKNLAATIALMCALLPAPLSAKTVPVESPAPAMTVELYVDANYRRFHKSYKHDGGDLPKNIMKYNMCTLLRMEKEITRL
jgi:hypothetical protein